MMNLALIGPARAGKTGPKRPQTPHREASMQILIAVDGSAHTKRMLGYLTAHNDWLGQATHRFTVVNVTPWVPAMVAGFLSEQAIADYYRDEAAKVLTPVRAFFKQAGLSAEFISLTGHAAEGIVKVANQNRADLIVMGSHGHGAWAGLALGSVSNQVLAQSKVPVLIVR